LNLNTLERVFFYESMNFYLELEAKKLKAIGGA